MKIKVFIEREGKEREMDFRGKSVRELLEYLNLPESEYIVVVNGKIALPETEINEGDYIEIIDVVSGG